MRIGIDTLALQSASRHRGIGRSDSNLVSALLARDEVNQYFLYGHDGLPTDQIPSASNATLRLLRPDASRGETTVCDGMDRLARSNPDGLDVLLLLDPLNPFERHPDSGPPARPINGPKLAAVVYDLIPFLFPEQYLTEPAGATAFYRRLERLRRYDLLLTISGTTREDCLRLLGLPGDRVVSIDGASDGRFFVPDRSEPMPAASRAALHRLGIDRPFVFHLGGMDDRKNHWGLIDAFAKLPAALRRSHQLVVTGFMTDAYADRVCQYARDRGVADHLVVTNQVPDTTLRVLYQRCAAFAFPSHYEGFGRPILEALSCGAAVVAGNNSAQVEVVGQAGLLVETRDPTDIAAKLGRVLADGELAARLRGRAVEQARRFSCERSAGLAQEALAGVVAGGGARRRVDRGPSSRPRLALFAPLPPKGTAIADYAVELARVLGATYAIDLYHDAGYVPHLGRDADGFGCYDYRLFERRAELLGYHGVVYQMGNSALFHSFLYELMLRHPGVVTLHDFSLAAFHEGYARHRGSTDHLLRELESCWPGGRVELAAVLDGWMREEGGVPVACARRGVYLNRRLFEHAAAVVVHSPWCLARLRDLFPEHLGRTTVIPPGVAPLDDAVGRRTATRARWDWPVESLVVACFGGRARGELYDETIEAFAPLARAVPTALLALVGQDLEDRAARRRVAELGLGERVRFLGRPPAADRADLIAAVDVGVDLRRAPTDGETSATLLELLRAGVPTIVNDVGTFSDYPDAVVRKVRWESEGIDGLARALRELADDPSARAALARSASAYVAERHGWSGAGAKYVEVIERCHTQRPRPGGGRRILAEAPPGSRPRQPARWIAAATGGGRSSHSRTGEP